MKITKCLRVPPTNLKRRNRCREDFHLIEPITCADDKCQRRVTTRVRSPRRVGYVFIKMDSKIQNKGRVVFSIPKGSRTRNLCPREVPSVTPSPTKTFLDRLCTSVARVRSTATIVTRFLAGKTVTALDHPTPVFTGFKSSGLFSVPEVEDGRQTFCHRRDDSSSCVTGMFRNVAETDISRAMEKVVHGT